MSEPITSNEKRKPELTIRLSADGQALVVEAKGALADIHPDMLRKLEEIGFRQDGGLFVAATPTASLDAEDQLAIDRADASLSSPEGLPIVGPIEIEDNLRKIEAIPALVTRWLDLSAYGMALKMAADDGHRWATLENGGKDPELALRLGFRDTPQGWVRFDETLDPVSIRKIAPKVEVRPFIREDMLDVSRMSTQPSFKAGSLSAKLRAAEKTSKLDPIRQAFANRRKLEALPAVFSNWVDLSAVGMKLKLVTGETRLWFELEGGDKDAAFAERLGFHRKSEGNGWVREYPPMNEPSFAFQPTEVWSKLFADRVRGLTRGLFYRDDVLDASRMSGEPDFMHHVSKEIRNAHTPMEFLEMRENRRQIENMAAVFPNWVDLSAYGLQCRIVCDDRSRWYELEGADANPEMATKLGFVQSDEGWIRKKGALNPNEVVKVAPAMEVVKAYREDMLDVSRMSTPPVFSRPSAQMVESGPAAAPAGPRP